MLKPEKRGGRFWGCGRSRGTEPKGAENVWRLHGSGRLKISARGRETKSQKRELSSTGLGSDEMSWTELSWTKFSSVFCKAIVRYSSPFRHLDRGKREWWKRTFVLAWRPGEFHFCRVTEELQVHFPDGQRFWKSVLITESYVSSASPFWPFVNNCCAVIVFKTNMKSVEAFVFGVS